MPPSVPWESLGVHVLTVGFEHSPGVGADMPGRWAGRAPGPQVLHGQERQPPVVDTC